MSYENIDLLIVGAGVVGCVVAERAATQLGWKCLVLDKRDHIAGNCYDYLDENGLLVPQYNPQFINTQNIEVINYLSQFTAWIPVNFTQKIDVNGTQYAFPINLSSIKQFFKHPELTKEETIRLIEEIRENSGSPSNAEEYILSIVGKELYEAIYLSYIQKHWGKHPKELSPFIFSEQLISFEETELADTTQIQLMPIDGYSRMFNRVLNNPLIDIELETNYLKVSEGAKPSKATLYTGSLDEYFNYKQGELPWQKVKYTVNSYEKDLALPTTKVIHTAIEDKLIFKSEIKQLTRQESKNTMVTSAEIDPKGEKYLPIYTPENLATYERYRQITEHETFINKVYFSGGLPQYKLMNIAESTEAALDVFERMKEDLT